MIFQGLIFFGFFKLFLNSKHPKNFWHTQGPNDDVCQVDPCADVYPVNKDSIKLEAGPTWQCLRYILTDGLSRGPTDHRAIWTEG